MAVEDSIEIRPGRIEVYGQSQLYHCNHYNRSIQQYIEDPDYVPSERILLQSAAETAYRQAQAYLDVTPDATLPDLLAWAEDIFKWGGFGQLDFSDVTEAGGTVVGKTSHYGLALANTGTEREVPGEFFDRGFVAGILRAAGDAFDTPLADGFDLTQPASISMGDDHCEFVVDADSDYQWLEYTTPTEIEWRDPPGVTAETAIDEESIIEAVQDLGLTGNEEGLIPAFGVNLTAGYAEYYNKGCFRYANTVVDEMGDIDVATDMLQEAGHICGFNTMGGIMTSPEWDAVVKPMIESREDWIHGIVACINALGWGTWRVEELVPDERLVVRIYNPYESAGYERWFGVVDFPVDFTASGVANALMNLVYYGDITDDPTLDDDYYYELFVDKGGFEAEQTKCVAAGDDYSEIVVTR
jgi:hypothetical protein